jgi:hypothetical protein
MGLILLLTLLILFIAALPRWTYAQQWGYGPSAILGLAVIILLILVVLDKFPFL